MRKRRILACAIFLVSAMGSCTAALAQDDDSTYVEPFTPDPVQNNGVHFAPAMATAGTAAVSATASSIKTDKSCTPVNPCASPTPALDVSAPHR